MNREQNLKKLLEHPQFDFLIIGGGASGLGTAVEASTRGFSTVLFESIDFAKGTSSRSTKLVHGGVRYLAQGNIKLVKDALAERGILSKNAPHLFKNQTFIIPNYTWWGGYYYAIGLKVYDFLSKKLSLGKSRLIKAKKAIEHIHTLNSSGLKSAVTYQDGQFDDARLAVNLAQTACEHGAVVLNYMKVIGFLKDDSDQLIGVTIRDEEAKIEYDIYASVIINATGVFANKIMKLNGRKKTGLKVVPSQGIHLVVDGHFLPGNAALMVPKTSDGRVLFAIPWHGKTLIGTTDTPINKPSYDPIPQAEEIDFILKTAGCYLNSKPQRKDVLSVFAGLRPLVAPAGDKKNSKEISRGHQILVSETGLISILGGKWTTYRKMAEEIVDKAIEIHDLPKHHSISESVGIQANNSDQVSNNTRFKIYGSDCPNISILIEENRELQTKIHPNYDYVTGQIIWAVREEMARTIEDVLARRIRLLFLDAQAAIEAAPLVANVMAKEMGQNDEWRQEQINTFVPLANQYLLN